MSDTLLDLTTEVDITTIVTPYEESDDPNRKTHIVNPPKNLHIWRPGMSAQDVVNLARMQEKRVVALCGHTWVPKHNPEKFDICDRCMKIAVALMSEAGE